MGNGRRVSLRTVKTGHALLPSTRFCPFPRPPFPRHCSMLRASKAVTASPSAR